MHPNVSSKKFLANNNKKSDLTNIKNLIKNLDKVDCNKIICISTIDVFDNKHSNENTKIVKKNLLPYGYNRLQLINFIKKKFKNYLIIKLPSLFGNNERKGFFYDLIKFKNIKFYNEKSELQWYYTPFLSKDIKKLKNSKIREINLVSEPISCGSIIKKLNLKRSFNNTSPIIKYNINTNHKYRHIKYSYKKNHILKLMKDYLKN